MKLSEFLSEGKQQLVQENLPYGKSDLAPVMSEDTINYHYGKLYKTYVERYNEGEGDPDFNEAGAFLHNIYFGQLQKPEGANRPYDAILQFIEKHFDTFDSFKEEFEKTAMTIQGSGWAYLARDGSIKTIVNHEIKQTKIISKNNLSNCSTTFEFVNCGCGLCNNRSPFC